MIRMKFEVYDNKDKVGIDVPMDDHAYSDVNEKGELVISFYGGPKDEDVDDAPRYSVLVTIEQPSLVHLAQLALNAALAGETPGLFRTIHPFPPDDTKAN